MKLLINASLALAILTASAVLAFVLWQKKELSKADFFSPKVEEHLAESYFYSTIGSLKPEAQISSTQNLQSYSLEVFTTESESRAKSEVEKLTQGGFDAFYTPFNRNGEVVYKVRIGLFQDPSSARKEAKQLSQKRGIQTRIVRF